MDYYISFRQKNLYHRHIKNFFCNKFKSRKLNNFILCVSICWGPFFQSTWHYFIGNPCHINILLIFWVNLFKTQNKLISYSTPWIGLTRPARSFLQEADSWSSLLSSIGIIAHDIININIWIGLKQWIKTHSPYYLSYTHGKRLL